MGQHALQVEGHDESGGGGAEEGQPSGGDAQAEDAVGEEAQFQHRGAEPQFPPDERHHCDDDQAGADDYQRRSPAESVAVADDQQQHQQDDAGQGGANPIKGGVGVAAMGGGSGATLQDEQGNQQDEAAGGDVDEEDPLPAEVGDEESAQGGAGDGAESDDAEVHPRALPRSVSGKAAMNIPMPQPCTMPEPMPCKMRKRMSQPNVGAKVEPREPATKMAVPRTYTRRRPMTSPRRPMGSSSTLMVRA